MAKRATDPGFESKLCSFFFLVFGLALILPGAFSWAIRTVLMLGCCQSCNWMQQPLESDSVLPSNRQMLLYSQEVEGDYNPCEEDLFVL